MSRQTERFKLLTVAGVAGLLVASLFLSGCSVLQEAETFGPQELFLLLEFRSGGPAPVAFTLAFLHDGRVRFQAPSWRVHWAKLSSEDQRALKELCESAEFTETLARLREGSRFGCCDFLEVGVSRSLTEEAAALVLEGPKAVPPPAAELVRRVNRLGKKYFGRRYSLPIPEPRAGGSSAP